jgi:hypothetical protein
VALGYLDKDPGGSSLSLSISYDSSIISMCFCDHRAMIEPEVLCSAIFALREERTSLARRGRQQHPFSFPVLKLRRILHTKFSTLPNISVELLAR